MNEFGVLDQFFARRLLKEAYTDRSARFLSKLMQESRLGHLCLIEKNPPELPVGIIGSSIIQDEDRFYLQKNWAYETEVLTHVRRLKEVKPQFICDEELFENEISNANLEPKQKEATRAFLKQTFTILSGGPGTGKTYTVATFVRSLIRAKQKNLKIYLTAPTGKAASHLKSVIGIPDLNAMTLHRLLGVQPGTHRKVKKIDADLVIIDEASMLDVPLLAKTLGAVEDKTRLILMGDPDQLPPVEAGSIFKEMSDLFGFKLEKSMRVEDSTLHELADQVNRGKLFDSSFLANLSFDSKLPLELYEKINPLISETKLEPDVCLNKFNQFRILDALKLGPYGTASLNEAIFREMKRRIQPNKWWSIPIMITKNTPRLDLYNGSTGILIGKAKKGLDFRDSIAYFPEEVPFRELPQFELAFCLSIHKAQGSEFDSVLALFPQGSENFGREALYTAITRGKKKVQIVSEPTILEAMLSKRSLRTSGFTARF